MINVKQLSTALGLSIVIIILGLIIYSEYYQSNEIKINTILDTNQTILDQPLHYPDNTPHISTKIIVIPIGSETGFHTHDEIMIGYILKGEITVDYGDYGKKVYSKGDSLIEAIDVLHNGVNTGHTSAEIFVVTLNDE